MSRQSIIENSAVMIGRNIYSQSLRQCALKAHSDGKYYSDCSSFTSAAFMSAGYDVGWNNTYSFCENKLFYTVLVVQVGRNIQNAASVLKVADVIVWPGHCNMVHHIDGNIVYVQDHGSGNPKIKTLDNSCQYHTGDIVVRRLKALDDEDDNSQSTMTDTVENTKEVKTGLYKVQSGAYNSDTSAKRYSIKLISRGFNSYVVKKGDVYTVQCGAFTDQTNASDLADKLREAGFEAYVWLDE